MKPKKPSALFPRTAAVVVLYHPGDDIFDTIASYAGQVDCVIAVDNTDEAPLGMAENMAGRGIVYLQNHANWGVARGLNIGAEKAAELSCSFLLTMDQDSTAAPDMVGKMLECLSGLKWEEVGLISPFHVTRASKPPVGGEPCSEVMTPMTSGCLLSLAAYRGVGPFRDDFFIDFVDNEYCLRLRRHGFRVIRANQAHLTHNVGDIRKYGPFIATNHSPLRRYYKTRNRFWVFREYLRDFPGHCLFDLVRLSKEIASIVLFEEEKGAKLRMMWRGWRDFRQGRFGRYEG
ncbi:glycosyltransferase family 2 protein [Geobacter sp.]|uniref:glycosyltransferase family 2 protein n=1 Tax=Geobacter sp. TaxID=46610 RepID=UPI00262844AA|nr:glycosyltransferase family 2 protein [Geobacter sp.]